MNNRNMIEYKINNVPCTKRFIDMYADICRILNYFKSMQIEQSDKIGICMFNSYEWVLIDLACFLGGYHSVVFPSNHFRNDFNQLISKYQLRLLILDQNMITESSAEQNDSIIRLPVIMEFLKSDHHVNLFHENLLDIPEPNRVFTTIFTSGTTSVPKAIEIKANVIDDYIACMQKRFPTDGDDKIILYLPFWSFPQRLYVYASIALRINIVMSSLQGVSRTLRKSRPTIMQGVPHFFKSIQELYSNSKNSFASKNSFVEFWGGKMKYLITGSAPIHKHILSYYFENGLQLFETYGLTETGITTMNYPEEYRLGSVGKVVEDKEITLTDSGEILIRGKYCWGNGYLFDSAENNRKVFREDGYISTGDIGKFDDDGFLYITGRIKEMIVLSNGHKYHPYPIEEKLCAADFVSQAIVFGEGMASLGAILVVDPSRATKLKIDTWISKINEELPSYAALSSIIVSPEPFSIDNGMLTASMKLNREKIYDAFKAEMI